MQILDPTSNITRICKGLLKFGSPQGIPMNDKDRDAALKGFYHYASQMWGRECRQQSLATPGTQVRFSDLPKVTELVTGRAGVNRQGFQIPLHSMLIPPCCSISWINLFPFTNEKGSKGRNKWEKKQSYIYMVVNDFKN